MKTIKQLAGEMGVTKQAIQKRLSREPLKTSLQAHVSMVDGTKFIDDDGETLIKAAYAAVDAPIDASMDKGMDTSTDAVQTLISMLQSELDIKNRQIEALNIALLNAQEEAKGAQYLHAGTMQKQLSSGEVAQDVPKKSFFARLFGK